AREQIAAQIEQLLVADAARYLVPERRKFQPDGANRRAPIQHRNRAVRPQTNRSLELHGGHLRGKQCKLEASGSRLRVCSAPARQLRGNWIAGVRTVTARRLNCPRFAIVCGQKLRLNEARSARSRFQLISSAG